MKIHDNPFTQHRQRGNPSSTDAARIKLKPSWRLKNTIQIFGFHENSTVAFINVQDAYIPNE